MQLIDSHCHLDDNRFKEAGIAPEEIIARALEGGVTCLQSICTKRRNFAHVHALSMAHPQVVCAFGIHPHEAENEWPMTVEELVETCSKPKVTGVGETGLDYYYDHAPREKQRKMFEMHIEAAQALGMPVIIHTRDAEDDTMEIIEAALKKQPTTFILHCFTGSEKLARFAVERGIYVSASGVMTFKKNTGLQHIFSHIVPENLLLIETDAPWLAPEPYRGKTNEPAWVRHVAQKLADLREIPLEKLANLTAENFYKAFPKATA